MKKNSLPFIAGGFLSLTILFYALSLLAQEPLCFSGKWTFNQEKSKAAAGTSFSGSEVTLDILHNKESFRIKKTIKNPGGMIDTTFEEYALDGQEKITKEASVVTKRTGNWSSDKKQIILSQTISLGSNIFTTVDTYSLSDNRKVLTIHSNETMNSKKSKNILVFEKNL